MALVDKIAALLAMAERTTNEHEAEAFLAKAQALATHNSIDLALARAATSRAEQREQPTSTTITIGAARAHSNKHLIELILAIAAVNDLKVDIAHNSTYVIAFGMPSDIEVAHAMFNSIATQMLSAGHAWLARGEWRGETFAQMYHDGRGKVWTEQKPVSARTAKGSFYSAYISRISARLRDSRTEAFEARVQAETENPAAVVSVALVLRDKAQEVSDFHKTTSKARGSWSGYSGNRGASSRGAQAGRSAADSARITSQAAIS